MVVVLLANGFEELEALTPVDVLRRNNIDVRTVSITNEKLITGTHGIQVATDLIASDVPLSDIDMLILPGGMPGVKNLDASPITKIFIDATLKNHGRLAAICAAPSIFGRHGMLTNIRATCFPGFEGEMLNAILSDKNVVTDGVFTTAKDYRAATEFADELVRVCDKLGIKPHDENEVLPIAEEDDSDLEELTFIDDETEEGDSFSFEELLKGLGGKFKLVDEEEELVIPEPEKTVDTGYDVIGMGGLTDEDMAEIKKTATALIEVLAQFNVKASVKKVERGPRLTRYAVVPAKGVKVNSITNLYRDICLNLAKEGIRMEAPIPGMSAIGFEIPNDKPGLVDLRSLVESEEFASLESKTAVAIGKDISGTPIYGDISKYPHALICGATGMGKSICINSILASLIYKSTPDDLRFILIDPKKVEFKIFDGLPHLLTPVITEAKDAAAALHWANDEMERRYALIEANGVRNIDAYNAKVKADPTLGKTEPKIVIVIDELADLMMQVRDPAEDLIMRIAQKARAAGIHLLISTQRPSVQIITGTIKANIPTRICLKVTSQVDSRTVLDAGGAESLLSRGDMLYWPVSSPTPMRVQCAYISDSDVQKLVENTKEKYADAAFDANVATYIADFKLKSSTRVDLYGEDDDDGDRGYYSDELFLAAVDIAISTGKISTSLLQRKLSIGYGKAAKYIDAMEEIGIISGPRGQKPREVLITKEEWLEKLARVQ